ncbi:MAG: response regulator transcription factor [Candidatus Marinimicrobia bacterium]|nr:response regulator transcription factor [Candidatus Neomarinimicrobiota bacterium]
MEKLKALIIDDEWLIRHELRLLLEEYTEIEVVGEADNVDDGLKVISETDPDVIFLDIKMPQKNGFELVERIDSKYKIVFITAYDQYAVKAFEINALDYLLKPINKQRLKVTIDRIKKDHVSTSEPASHKFDYNDYIYLLVGGSRKFIRVSNIKCIEAQGNYSYVYYGEGNKDIVTKTLKDWERILPSKYFARIHRSVLVNINYIEDVRKCNNQSRNVFIKGLSAPFKMSRRYASKLKKLFIV